MVKFNIARLVTATRARLPRITNIRFGFATNSSSSHSLVYLNDDAPRNVDVNAERPPHEYFGWEDFRLGSVKAKLTYWLSDNVRNWSWQVDEEDRVVPESEMAELVTQFPELTREEIAAAITLGVDHQSSISEGGIGLTPDLCRDPSVVVFGGNDNEYDEFSGLQAAAKRAGEIDMKRSGISDSDRW